MVVAASGSRIAEVGSPDVRVVVRSSIKPFQALELFASGAWERFGLTPQELALSCASHSGLAFHRATAEQMLGRGGLGVDHLQCGSHFPFDRLETDRLKREGREPTPLHNNCSGKHAAMLLSCQARGWPLVGYLEPEHPLQVAIREHLREVLQLDQEEPFPVAVDGCSAPTYALPLEALARGYAALADPEATALDRERSQALLKLRDAMGGYPEWVAGPGRFTTELIRATGGRILGKEGAEGVYALANRGPMPWGAALKIADGSERARDTIVLALLEELGALSFGERRALESQFLRPVQNHRGMEVGSIEPLFELEWAADFRSKVVSSSGEERGH